MIKSICDVTDEYWWIICLVAIKNIMKKLYLLKFLTKEEMILKKIDTKKVQQKIIFVCLIK